MARSGWLDEVGLVEHDLVGEGDLLARLAAFGEAEKDMLGVDHRGHRIEPGSGFHVLVDEERLRDRPWIGEARGLNDDGVERLGGRGLALHQALENADQVAAHGAADAAIVHLDNFFIRPDDQVVVDAALAELVDDHGVAFAVILGEDAIEKRGLAGAEIAGEDGDGGLGHSPYLGSETGQESKSGSLSRRSA